MEDAGVAVVDGLRRAGVGRGDLVGLAIAPGTGLGLATPGGRWAHPAEVEDPAIVVESVEQAVGPRWVLWSSGTAEVLVRAGLRVARCWDVAAVHRLLCGGWRAEPARVWAEAHGLELAEIPDLRPPDLFSQAEQGADPDEPVRPDGHLDVEWLRGGWSATPERLARWAELAVGVAELQRANLAALPDPVQAAATVRSESAAELLCAELSVDGLPVDRSVAEAMLGELIGPRPRTEPEAAAQRARRDAEVLRHLPPGRDIDLRSPGQVRSLLRRVGIEVPDTRAWRLEALRDAHPVVDAILAWRKAERIATTYGYAWLDEHVGEDGRLRGAWSGSDGAAGRMTASAGLHNMPAVMRGAVLAEPGHVFVRADLGQIEPRVLAAISGDQALARATLADDMYAPVAEQLAVDRPTAKVTVLGAMYGQTSGRGAEMQHRLRTAYPVATAYLDQADRAGQAGQDLRTHGGRLIRMGPTALDEQMDEREARGRAAARGRYGRNALVQGAAAELFKAWAATVRARAQPLGACIVLCLHDELLVHAPGEHGDATARLLDDCLQEAAGRWTPNDTVRFVADISITPRWSSPHATDADQEVIT